MEEREERDDWCAERGDSVPVWADKKNPHFFSQSCCFFFNIFFFEVNKLFSSCTVHPLDLEKLCVICRDTSLGYLYRYWGSVQLTYLYQFVYICVYMTHQVLKSRLSHSPCCSASVSCQHANVLPPVAFPGRPVQNSEAVPVHRLARAGRTQIWGGLHRLHRPGA